MSYFISILFFMTGITMSTAALKYLESFQLNFDPRKESIGAKLSNIALKKSDRHSIREQIKDKFIIIGIQDERGVLANAGNPGAKEGPHSFRQSFYKLYDTQLRRFNPSTHRPYPPDNSSITDKIFLSDKFIDMGNIILAEKIEETHERIAQVVEFFLKNEAKLIFVIGGGHDFTYGSYKGHVNFKRNEVIPIINYDAHFDLRPVENGNINSGSAFYRIINDFKNNIVDGKALLEIGIQRDRNPHSLYQFVQKHNIKTVEYISLLNTWRDFKSGNAQIPLEHIYDHLDDCSKFGFNRNTGSIHISFCLDVFDQSIAPGTSASTPLGVHTEDLSQSLAFFGKSHTCRVMDIAELCPARDTHDQTARLCASMVYRIALLREEYSNR